MRRQREVSALRLSHLEGMRRIAAQVAHDIRSPAAALRQLVTELPEAKRRVALMAVERISEVSRDVLGYERASRREPDAPTEHVAAGPLTTVDVLGAVRQIAEERNAGAAGGGPGRIQLSGAAVGPRSRRQSTGRRRALPQGRARRDRGG
jgi:signal transduction histidine kinase